MFVLSSRYSRIAVLVPVISSVLVFAPFAAPRPAQAQAFSQNATNNATVRPGGPRAAAAGKNFFNIEGDSNGANASYGVADYTVASFGAGQVASVSNISVQLTQANAVFTAPGTLNFYLASDTATSIEPAPASPLVYNAALGSEGIATTGGQLGNLFLLGSGAFTTTGNVNNGQVDTFALTPSAQSRQFFASALNGGGTLRLVITPATATTAATYGGFSNTTAAGPILRFDAVGVAVPEPGTLALLVPGIFGFAGFTLVRRNRRARSI